MSTRRDVASRRSAPSSHVATTTRQRGPFSRCHKVPFLLAISRPGTRMGSTRDVLQLSKRGRRAMGRVEQVPSHATIPNSLLMN